MEVCPILFVVPVSLYLPLLQEPSPLLLKVADELTMEVEDSQDTETDNVPESVNISSEEVSTPQPEKSTKKVGKVRQNFQISACRHGYGLLLTCLDNSS